MGMGLYFFLDKLSGKEEILGKVKGSLCTGSYKTVKTPVHCNTGKHWMVTE